MSVVEHILLMKWNEQASQEAIDRVFLELRGLKEKIPGIEEVSCGKNFSERAKGYTHGVVMRFKNRAALTAYFPHPEHQRVVKTWINPILAEILALDYEDGA
jgi:hypothetical protein